MPEEIIITNSRKNQNFADVVPGNNWKEGDVLENQNKISLYHGQC